MMHHNAMHYLVYIIAVPQTNLKILPQMNFEHSFVYWNFRSPIQKLQQEVQQTLLTVKSGRYLISSICLLITVHEIDINTIGITIRNISITHAISCSLDDFHISCSDCYSMVSICISIQFSIQKTDTNQILFRLYSFAVIQIFSSPLSDIFAIKFSIVI